MKTNLNVKHKLSTARRAARHGIGAAVACSALSGCAGGSPVVRPAPPAEECPVGAVENMEKLGINLGILHVATFDSIPKNTRPIIVEEGPASVFIVGDWKKMTGGTQLFGRLIFADRIYGRFTQAVLNGRTINICMEANDLDGGRGLIREPHNEAETAKVYSAMRLRPVSSFE